VLRRLAVVSEVKVAATTGAGLDHTGVARDVWKLSLLLSEYQHVYPDEPVPLAFVCVLDNHPSKTYSWDHLERVIDRVGKHPGVKLLSHSAGVRPALTVP